MIVGVCRLCGCTDSTACVLEATQKNGATVVQPCWWVEDDLCSGCESLEQEELPEDDQDEGGETAAAAEAPLLYDAFDRPIALGGRR